MVKSIFITGTGTDVGKTFVSALIVKKLRELNYNCGYYKPVLSGAEIKNGKIFAGDCEFVAHTANLAGNPTDFSSYIFKPALSPHLASQIENNPIKLDKIKSDYIKISENYDYVVVEGAGGIVCPMDLSKEQPFLIEDIIKGLNLDVIIVATSVLGSINSAVTTVEYAKNHGINVRGIILNKYDESDEMQADNKLQIEKLTHIPIVATVKQNSKNIEFDINKIFNYRSRP